MTDVPSLPISDERDAAPLKTSNVAICSLILGILSNMCLWLLGSIPAIILGIIAIKSINRSPTKYSGKGLAIAGIITGSVGSFIGFVGAGLVLMTITGFQKGTHTAKCRLNAGTIQKLVLYHADKANLTEGDKVSIDDLISKGYLEKAYVCPDGGTYTILGEVPSPKVTYLKCDIEGHVLNRAQAANKEKCRSYRAGIQILVMFYANKKNLSPGDPVTLDDLIDADVLGKEEQVNCPSGGNYTSIGKVPDLKTPFLKCDHEGHIYVPR